MTKQLQRWVWVGGVVALCMVQPTWAQEVEDELNGAVSVPLLNDLEQPATTVEEWISQIQTQQLRQAPVQIRGVQINPTEMELEIVLETDGNLDTPSTSTVGNALIAEISNAVLTLGDRNEFQQANPIAGIALVSITNLPNNRVRVAITGVDAPPVAVFNPSLQGLVLSIAPGTEAVATDEDAIQVVVTGEQEEGYQVNRVTTATRTETPLLDVPRAVQVVPQEVIRDQQATTVGDALRNVSGISQDSTPLSIFSDFIRIRGFTIGRDYFTNGIRNQFTGYNLGQETANIERIEVLKGPASVLYGQAEPGGAINIITEQPLSEPYYAVDFTAGSFDSYRPTLDFSGPLNDEGTILYRLNFAYQSSGTFVDDIDFERYFVAPVVSVQLGNNTILTFEGQYLDYSGLLFSGLPAEGTVLPNPFGDISLSEPLDAYPGIDDRDRSVGNIGYRFEHDFNENWSIRNAFRYEFFEAEEEEVFLNELLEDNRTVTRGSFRLTGRDESYVFQTDVTGRFVTGPLNHNLVFGTEFRRVATAGELFNADVPPIDIFDRDESDSPLDFVKTGDGQSFQNIFGFYAQDLIAIGERWRILLGGRLDVVDQTVNNFLTGEEFEQNDTAFSPQVGVVYRVAEPVSLFASYSRSFVPSSADSRNPDSSTFEPTRGEQFELGVRTELFDNRVIATLTGYHLTRQNVPTTDPDRPEFTIQIGEERSQGVELDVIGEILPGFNIIASYAYTDTEITRDNTGIEGNRPYNVPLHSGSLWLTYELQQGALKGLGFGGGVFFVGDREGDNDNSFELPSYARVDAAVSYRQENWEVALNVKNLFDIDYYESSFSRTSVIPGAPFTILGTVSVRF